METKQVRVTLARALKIAERLNTLIEEQQQETFEAYNLRTSLEEPVIVEPDETPLEGVLALYEALNHVRTEVGRANTEFGVSSRLTAMSTNSRLLQTLTDVQNLRKRAGKRVESVYGQAPATLYHTTTAPDVTSVISKVKAQNIRLSDEIAQANQREIALTLNPVILAKVMGEE